MKAIIEFTLPEDYDEYKIFQMAPDMFCVIHDFNQKLRAIWKYEQLNDQQFEMVEKIREIWFVIVNENKIKDL